MTKRLVVSDLSAIEMVVLAWWSRDRGLLRIVHEGLDPYKAFAQAWLGLIYDLVWQEIRNLCKPPMLGCGYGLGVSGLIEYADRMGIEMDKDTAMEAVSTYRSTYSGVPELWKNVENSVRAALYSPGKVFGQHLRIAVCFESRFLTIRLPSGRKLYYDKPEILDGEITYVGQNQYTGKWERLRTWGGKLCLSKETLVATQRGWIPIEQVGPYDQVFDGVEFVNHGGRVFNGLQPCVKVSGVQMTPDHEVLTDEGWKEASLLQGHNGAKIRYVDRDPAFAQRWKEMDLAFAVRLREYGAEADPCVDKGGEKRRDTELRVRYEKTDRRKEHPARNVEAPRLLGVEEHVGSMQTSLASSLEELRRKGDKGVRPLVLLRDFLVGYWRQILHRLDVRENRQQRELRTGECDVGSFRGSSEKPPGFSPCGHTKAFADVGNRKVDSLLQMEQRPVYDIINSGPRKRFVVLGEDGPFIVHNCENVVQAIAADLLAQALALYDQAGGTIVGHVHDEIIAEEDADRGETWLETMNECFRRTPSWGKDLVLDAKGYIATRYRKD